MEGNAGGGATCLSDDARKMNKTKKASKKIFSVTAISKIVDFTDADNFLQKLKLISHPKKALDRMT